MLNFNPKYFFNKELIILNGIDQTESIVRPLRNPANRLKYFPEGGQLIENIPSQLGFVAENELGETVDIKGRLLDQTGRQIANIKSEFLGFGSVFILPKREINYRSAIMSGEFQTDTLPEISTEGYALMVNNLKQNTIEITVRGTPRFEGRKFYLLVISNGVLFDRRVGMITKGLYRTEIPESILPGGVAQVLLVDDVGKITNRRLVFVNQPHDANLKYYLPKKEFKPRERVDMVLEVNDENGKALGFSNISISVLDRDKIARDNAQQNIKSYLSLDYLLDHQVKETGTLFNNFDRETLKRFEFIMLSQQTILPEIQSFEGTKTVVETSRERNEKLSLRGVAITKENIPLANGYISFISYPAADIGSWYVQTNQAGEFELSNIDLPDSTRVSVIAWNSGGQPVTVEIKVQTSNYHYDYERNSTVSVAMDSMTKKYMGILKKGTGESRNPGISGEYRTESAKANTPQPFGKPDNILKLDEKFRQYSNMYQLLKSKISGLSSEGDDHTFEVNIKGKKENALIIYDGLILNAELIPGFPGKSSTSAADRLKSMAVSEIDRIEMIDAKDFRPFGVDWKDGVIAIYSKEGSMQHFESALLTEVWLPGYQDHKIFTSPNYAESRRDGYDARTTLYWNPSVTTNRKGRAKISFYNSDEARNMQICVEGLTADGMPIFDLFDFGRNYGKTTKPGL